MVQTEHDGGERAPGGHRQGTGPRHQALETGHGRSTDQYLCTRTQVRTQTHRRVYLDAGERVHVCVHRHTPVCVYAHTRAAAA